MPRESVRGSHLLLSHRQINGSGMRCAMLA
ncbi:Uncharacterised protein [Vibrio cholerae]|nr:Uncharacterised protein [Vibrio cholerae]